MTSGTVPQRENDAIAITGMGAVSPVGQGVEAYWAGLLGGVSGIAPIERFSTHDMRVSRGGEIKQFVMPSSHDRPLPACRASQFLIAAAGNAA